ncbi:MAG: DUF1127 domain-containing protein [Acetobacteraceae bacterium]
MLTDRLASGSRPVVGSGSMLRGLKKHWARWSAWRRQRAALLSLSDADLKDIGISRAQANFEYNSAYWREPTVAGCEITEGVNRGLK